MSWRGVALLVAANLGGWAVGEAQDLDSATAAAIGIYRPVSPPDPAASAVPADPAATAVPADTAAGTVQAGTVQAGTVQAGTVQADTVQADTVQADTVQADTVQADTVATTVPPDTAETTARTNTAGTGAIAPQPADTAGTPIDTSLTARMDARRGGGLSRGGFPDLRSSAAMAGRYTVFLDLADQAKLGARLTGDSLLTVLAPTDSAFAQLPPGDLARLRDDRAFREAWLGTLLLSGSRGSSELLGAGEARSLAGAAIHFSRGGDGRIHVGPARLVQPDLIARNGMLHGVDRVILPDTTSASP